MNTNKTSIADQTPATTNSIAETKPYPQTTNNLLEGYVCNSFNGGIIKPLAYKKIMAGEKITNYSLSGIVRMVTPKVPVAQKLSMTLKCYFVPNNRVWTNHDKYLAQKGGSTVTKITKKPAFQATQNIPKLSNGIPITDTTLWRDSFSSSYIQRLYTGIISTEAALPLPEISILPIRGFKAIYNDMLCHKVYDTKFTEYNTDTVTTQEWNESIPSPTAPMQYNIKTFVKRGRRKDSYYTNYRTESEGKDNTIVPMYTDLMEHNEWQKKIAESRSRAENEQKNDWNIVAEIRGSRPISDGKVQFLSMKEIGINYQQIAQTAYNTNETIETDQQVLGATGSFSYTEFNISLINYHEFKEEGYIHIIAQTSADTVFETGIDRNELNITPETEYRPDYKDLKEDVLYDKETNGLGNLTENQIVGFKRKYSEYFKLPNCINGDMTSTPIKNLSPATTITGDIPLKKEFQFFETSNTLQFNDTTLQYVQKNRWQDYTDILINKNLAVRETVSLGSTNTELWVEGANQLFLIANAKCITNQPIDETIKNDFKKWGEQ